MVNRWIAATTVAAAVWGVGGFATLGGQEPPAPVVVQGPLTGGVACVAFEDTTGEAFRYMVVTVAITPSIPGSEANDPKWYDHPDARQFSSGRRGKFVWGDVQPGQYRLRASCAGYEGLRAMVEVVAGETTEVSLRFKRPGGMRNVTVVRARPDSSK